LLYLERDERLHLDDIDTILYIQNKHTINITKHKISNFFISMELESGVAETDHDAKFSIS